MNKEYDINNLVKQIGDTMFMFNEYAYGKAVTFFNKIDEKEKISEHIEVTEDGKIEANVLQDNIGNKKRLYPISCRSLK